MVTKSFANCLSVSRGYQLFEILYTCFEILLKIQMNLKSYCEKPYKPEAKQNQELYESSLINLYYRIQLYVRRCIKPGKEAAKNQALYESIHKYI